MIYEDETVGRYIVGDRALRADFANQYDQRILVKKAPGVSLADARETVDRVALSHPREVFNQDEFNADQGRSVDQLLTLVYAFLALAIVIALLGIGQHAGPVRLRAQPGAGRAAGGRVTRSQLLTIRWESLIIVLQGTVPAVGIGLFFGWVTVHALADEAIDTFQVPFGDLTAVVVLAALAGVLAAVAPSRRAAKLNVLRAIAAE